ncbi:MAG: glutamine-hydrolyzing GMP synthase [Paludibacter sp.]|nr:glutamine-hydrolyzing GMP synthase [Paludibacter sp.]
MLEKILILDFGSQTTQLIGRRIRELNEFCEILPYHQFPSETSDIKGVILSGSPFSVYDNDAFKIDLSKIIGKFPVLGICYGAQFIANFYGGKVENTSSHEYGRANLTFIDNKNPLFENINEGSQVWMSHGDTITSLPIDAQKIASTADVEFAAYCFTKQKIWGVQFHPEVFHTTDGTLLLENFLKICGCKRKWTPSEFINATIKTLKKTLGSDKVILGLSGGVDSSVVALLLHKAIGKNLTCIFVDHGMLRKNEFESVLNNYKYLGINILGIDAKDYFFEKLKGIADPESKRKIIGNGFIEVFQQQAQKIKGVKWLAQGTIYPDIIESLSISGTTIKSHHNVGGLPEKMNLQLCEPLRMLFKDEVRRVGFELGMMRQMISRHPFPGPGLAVRILGEVSPEKVQILQEADDIFINGLLRWNLYDKVWQAGVILLPVKSVGVMGDARTYDNVVALRAVTSTDAMTADWVQLPYDFLAKISNEIINKVNGVNRVVYDISSKPPATIEWE